MAGRRGAVGRYGVGPLGAFDRDTAVRPLGAGRYAAEVHDAWFVLRGANGGYVAAIVLKALTAELADPARHPRSLTIHYTAPPQAGLAEVAVTIERAGRSASTLSARLTQGDRLVALALATFAAGFPDALDFDAAAMPDVPPPDEVPPMPDSRERPTFMSNLDMRPALGPPAFSGAQTAHGGGWMRLREPHVLDASVVTAYADMWYPAPFVRLTTVAAAPTIDLTIHFRRPLPPGPDTQGAFVLGDFHSRLSRDGFFEEDGVIFSQDGGLLAQSRQLALLLPLA